MGDAPAAGAIRPRDVTTAWPVPFLIYPFETLWVRARAGSLNIGDPAPDFSLAKIDKSASIRLAELNSGQPVVLVFGSYT